jgi:hypothetical protein
VSASMQIPSFRLAYSPEALFTNTPTASFEASASQHVTYRAYCTLRSAGLDLPPLRLAAHELVSGHGLPVRTGTPTGW